jgi:hypothetical protein
LEANGEQGRREVERLLWDLEETSFLELLAPLVQRSRTYIESSDDRVYFSF